MIGRVAAVNGSQVRSRLIRGLFLCSWLALGLCLALPHLAWAMVEKPASSPNLTVGEQTPRQATGASPSNRNQATAGENSAELAGHHWIEESTEGRWEFRPLSPGRYKAFFRGQMDAEGEAWLKGGKLFIELDAYGIKVNYQLTLSRDGTIATGTWRTSEGESRDTILILR